MILVLQKHFSSILHSTSLGQSDLVVVYAVYFLSPAKFVRVHLFLIPFKPVEQSRDNCGAQLVSIPTGES